MCGCTLLRLRFVCCRLVGVVMGEGYVGWMRVYLFIIITYIYFIRYVPYHECPIETLRLLAQANVDFHVMREVCPPLPPPNILLSCELGRPCSVQNLGFQTQNLGI